MEFFNTISFDTILVAVMATVALREVLIILLPDTLAGPDGWLIKVAPQA